MKSLVKALRTIGNTIALVLGVKGEYRKEAEAEGYCYYNGQK